jgi:hypothetical protein
VSYMCPVGSTQRINLNRSIHAQIEQGTATATAGQARTYSATATSALTGSTRVWIFVVQAIWTLSFFSKFENRYFEVLRNSAKKIRCRQCCVLPMRQISARTSFIF